MRTCAQCNVDISHRHYHARYCSDLCKNRARPLTPARVASVAAAGIRYRERNSAVIAHRVAEWRRANANKNLALTAEWQRKHPEKTRGYAQARRARVRAATTYRFTDVDWRKLVNRFGGRCAYCNIRSAKLQLEHVIPLSRGGTHGVGNFLPACPTCNRSKGDRLLTEWRRP